MELSGLVPSASSIVGNLCGIIPRSVPAEKQLVGFASHIDHLPGGFYFSLAISP